MTVAPEPRSRMPFTVWIFAVAVPVVFGFAGVVLQLLWLPELPDPVAIHWGAADQPDGYGPAWSTVLISAILLLGLPAMFAGMLATSRGPAPTPTHKFLAATSSFMGVMLTTTLTGSIGMQRGLTDATEAGGITGIMLLGVGGGAVLAVVAWFAMPRGVTLDPHATSVQPLDLAPEERSAWITSVRIGGVAVVAISAAVISALTGTVIAIALGGEAFWPVVALPVVLLVASATSIAWRVRVDAQGLSVRAMPFGWPSVVIPVADIARVDTVQVEPLSEFGGYGWRWAPGRSFGVIARRGEAIEVERVDGRRFTVTVADAARGASLLAAYAQR